MISIWMFFAVILLFGAIIGFYASTTKTLTDIYQPVSGVNLSNSDLSGLQGLEGSSFGAEENHTADMFTATDNVQPDSSSTLWQFLQSATSSFSKIKSGVGIAKNAVTKTGELLPIPTEFLLVAGSLITLYILVKLLAWLKGLKEM